MCLNLFKKITIRLLDKSNKDTVVECEKTRPTEFKHSLSAEKSLKLKCFKLLEMTAI